MTQSLSKDVKTHVIITFAKTKHFITAEQNATLKRLRQDQVLEVDGASVRCSTIAVIQPVEDYYLANPDERPASPPRVFLPPPHEYVPLERQAEANKKRFHGLLIGLKRYIDNNPPAHNAKAMFNGRLKAYEALYGPFDGKETPLEKAELSKSIPTAEAWANG